MRVASGAEALSECEEGPRERSCCKLHPHGRARGRPYWDAEALRVTRVARLASTRARGRPYWDAAALRVARGARLASTVLLVSAGYYVGGIIGIALRFPPSGIATIWPPTAILLSALLLTPPRTWWVYLLAAIPTHIHLVANFQTDVPPVVMFAQVGTNVLHAVLAALAVRSAVGAPPRFDSLRSMVLYILYAPIASTIVACVLAASAFVLLGWAADFWLAFRQRVLANVFAIITIPPLIVITATGGLGAGHDRRWSRYAELGLLTMALLAVGFLVFGRVAPASGNVPALLLTPMPLLLWAAVRLGPGGLCVCLLVIAGLSLSEAFAGRGPFVTASPAENTFSLQVFLLAISAPLMILAAIVQERRAGGVSTAHQCCAHPGNGRTVAHRTGRRAHAHCERTARRR